jgi:hypothetical protein
MNLVNNYSKVIAAINKWKNISPSRLSFHNKDCCLSAYCWFIAMDQSFVVDGNVLRGPTWIRERWNWGPSKWPLYWCQIERLDALDCGALNALAMEAFSRRGLKVFPAQLIQTFPLQNIRHWRKKWETNGQKPMWILDDLVYHEATAVIIKDNMIEIWDPTDNWWILRQPAWGYGATLAIRINGTDYDTNHLKWKNMDIYINKWTIL